MNEYLKIFSTPVKVTGPYTAPFALYKERADLLLKAKFARSLGDIKSGRYFSIKAGHVTRKITKDEYAHR